MSRLLLQLALLACLASAVLAGDARAAARQLGRGVRLGQPSLALGASGSSAAASLAFSPSTAELCPVVAYSASVEPLAEPALLQLAAATGLQGKYAGDAKINAPPGAKPFKVVVKPLAYMHNATVPSVDWVDLHFRVGSGIQQSLQMKAVPAGGAQQAMSMAGSGGHSAMHSLVGASYEFGPIFLTKQDSLSFAFTICASMTDCNTEVHTFQEPEEQAQQQQQMPQQQMPGQQMSPQQMPGQQMPQQQPQSQQMLLPSPSQQAVRPGAASQQQQHSSAEVQQQQQMQQQQMQQQPYHPQQQQIRHQQQPQAEQQQQPSAARRGDAAGQQQQQQQSQQQPIGGCPAIAYTYKLDCGESECKASFVNLTPDKPLDWVDVHVVRSDEASMQRLIARAAAGPVTATALSEAATDVQQNFAMSLAAGAMGRMGSGAGAMHMPMGGQLSSALLSSPEHALRFGAASAPSTVLQQSGGAQVFQMPIPMQFRSGELVGVFFTYCQNGVDCDTEIAFFKLEDDGTGGSSLGQQQQQQQQQLGLRFLPSSAHAQLHTDL